MTSLWTFDTADLDEAPIRRGADAQLHTLRACFPHAWRTATEQFLRPDETILSERWMDVVLRIQLTEDDDNNNSTENNTTDDNESDDALESPNGSTCVDNITRVPARVLVTSERVVLLALPNLTEDGHSHSPLPVQSTPLPTSGSSRIPNYHDADTCIAGSAIELHALAQEDQPNMCVYLQCSSDGATPMLECFLEPLGPSTPDPTDPDNPGTTQTVPQQCQALFDALSTLVALHPVDPNESEEPQEELFGGGMVFGDDTRLGSLPHVVATGNGVASDDMVVGDAAFVAPPSTTSLEDHATTTQERDAILSRLDDLLIVPPEYEIDSSDTETRSVALEEGQFDDAEDDDCIL